MNRLLKIEQKADGSIFARIVKDVTVTGVHILDGDFSEASSVAELYDCVNVYDVEFKENELLTMQYKDEELSFFPIQN